MTAADLGYGQGSAYHAAGPAAVLLASQGTLMVAIMLLGFVRREEKGVGNIGFESWIVLAVAVATYLLLFTL